MKKTLTLSLLLAGIAQATTTSSEYTDQFGNSTALYVADDQTTVPDDVTGKETIILGSSNVNLGSDSYKGRYSLGNCDTLKNVGTIVIAQGSISDGSASNEYVGGQLFIQAAGEITSHLKLGTSGYNENQYGGAVRFHNETNDKLILTGGITLIQDASLSVGGKGAYIQGTIAGQGKNLTLTQTGELRLSGGATLQTLDSTAKVTLDDKKADGSTDAASKNYTMVNATGTGALTVDSGVNLTLTGHATDTALQTTSKSITNNGTIFIGESTPDDTPNTVILSGNVTGGTIQLHSNTNLRIASNVASSLNMEGSGNAKLIVAETGVVDVKNNFKMDADANTAVEIETGGQFKRGTWTYTNENTTNAVLRRTEVGVAGSKEWSGSSDQFTVTGAKLILTVGDWNESKNRLDDCSLVNSGSGEMRVYSAIVDNQLVALDVQSGTVSFRNRTAEEKIGALTLAGGKKVGLYSNNSKDITKITAVQVTDSLTTTGETSATIEASMLTLAEGVTLDFGSSVTLTGDLTMNSNLVLADGMLGEEGVTLFTGVTGLTLATGVYTAPVDAATVFAGVETGAYNLVFSDNVVSLQAAPAVPEPATATLSLLALAGLCARRRRK